MGTELRLGVNIDHVATVRNARGGIHPDPVRAAVLAEKAGASGITAHLREDRRHIADGDIADLMASISLPLNFEMAPTAEMLEIALRYQPHAACIVPETREERTTEGGLDAVAKQNQLKRFVDELGAANVRVSFFIEPDRAQIDAAERLRVPVIELHTGSYCEAWNRGDKDAFAQHLEKLRDAATYGDSIGLEVHAGHGLTFDTVAPIAAIPTVQELNIGHFLVGEAIFIGLEESVRQMRRLMDEARSGTIASAAQ